MDWPEVEEEIQKFSYQLPIFSKDFQKIKSNLYEDFTTLSRIEVEYRRTKNKNIELKKVRLLDKINQNLSTVENVYVIGLLTK